MDKGLLHVLKTEKGEVTFVCYLGSNHLRSDHGLWWDISFLGGVVFQWNFDVIIDPKQVGNKSPKPGIIPRLGDYSSN
jgi:hypothetical protein